MITSCGKEIADCFTFSVICCVYKFMFALPQCSIERLRLLNEAFSCYLNLLCYMERFVVVFFNFVIFISGVMANLNLTSDL